MPNLRPLPLFLSATFVLASGCSRPVAYPAAKTEYGTGCYQLNGRAASCWVEVFARQSASNTLSPDVFTVKLLDAPWPYDPRPYLSVEFRKSTGPLGADYHAASATYQPAGWQAPVFYQHLVGTLTETSPGVFAGTFASSRSGQDLTAGTFTGALLRSAVD